MSEKTEARVYEIGFLLIPSLTEGELPGAVDAIKKVITDAKGSVVAEGKPEFIDLAYQMETVFGSTRNKYRQGYFSWIKFDADPSAVEAIKKAADGMNEIIRHLILKTDIENTIIFKKPKDAAKRETFEELTAGLEEEALEEDLLEENIEEHEKLPEVTDDVAPAPEEKEE